MSLDKLSSIFFPSECNVDKELFYPVSKESSSMDCMVGYFTSGSLRELARTIAAYLSSSLTAPMRLIVSPSFSDADLQAIKDGLEMDENLIPLIFPDFNLDEDTLRSKSITALLVLIAKKKIELRVALKSSGILHTKCWLFKTPEGKVAIHGSGNATKGGLSNNFEQLILSRDWLDNSSDQIVTNLTDRFCKLWDNNYPGIYTFKINQKTLRYIDSKNFVDLDSDKVKAELIEEFERETTELMVEKARLKVPDWLNYRTGSFSHQGQAIEAWRLNKYNGILAIATGGGKTLTSLTGASLLNNLEGKLFVVVAVPTKPLLDQWAEEVKLFSIEPNICNGLTPVAFSKTIKSCFRNLRLDTSHSECIIVTHEALKSDTINEIKKHKKNIKTLLIADEVHNLGSVGFRQSAPDFFDFKIGLSATHERQYDEDGSHFLLDYFGGLVFEYGLDQAIGNCLVPYQYIPQRVQLTAEEEEEFSDLTYEIKKLAFAIDLPEGSPESDRLKILCMKRRKIIETAKNKIKAFESLIEKSPEKAKRALVFCSDKNPQQLKEVNNILNKNSIYFSQVTQKESGNKNKLRLIISDFNAGKLDVLTSMRVLDEGFNVPQTENVFLLASNTVRRQWVQRLGRVLRLSPKTGKKQSIIYDFVALPTSVDGKIDSDLLSLLRGEYERVKFFTNLANNSAANDGGLLLMSRILEMSENL
jgi:superfamily II DNA or RNA helicase